MLKNYLTCRLRTMQTFYVRKRNSRECILYVSVHIDRTNKHIRTHTRCKLLGQFELSSMCCCTNLDMTLQKKNQKNLHFYLSILCFGFCINSFSVRRFAFHIIGTNALRIPKQPTAHDNNNINTNPFTHTPHAVKHLLNTSYTTRNPKC